MTREDEGRPPGGPGPGSRDDPRAAGSQEWERVREARARARDARRRERDRRKEHVLHTRISDPLAEDIRRLADELRVPVSNLVRNVLEEAFSVASQVGEDVGELVDDVLDRASRASGRMADRRRRRADRGRAADSGDAAPEAAEEGDEPARASAPAEDVARLAEAFPAVTAWQPVVLNAPARCAHTGRALAPGSRAWLGLGAHGPTGLMLCDDVLAG